jgi:hypothetical protein
LHLLAQAYRRQELLSPEMRADVRREVGWAQARESLLADQAALRVSGAWRVVATLSEVQPDRLRRLETWLWREDAAEGPRSAVLVDFVPVAAFIAHSPFVFGERIRAELVYYPSPVPQRALIAQMIAAPQACAAEIALPGVSLSEALLDYERALCARPWLGWWLVAFRNARLRRSGERIYICAREDEAVCLPIDAAETTVVLPLLALDTIDGMGLWNGSSFKLCLAQTELGRWGAE